MADTAQNPDKSLGVLTTLSPIVFWFLVPLVVFLANRNNPEKTWLTAVAREALNFQLSITIFYFAANILAVLVGVLNVSSLQIAPLLVDIFLVFANLVLCVVAAIAAGNGEIYRYPLSLRFVK